MYKRQGLSAELSAATLYKLTLWHHALQLYHAREWELAGLQIYNLQQRAPGCRLYALYAEHIVAQREEPPNSLWNGVTTYQTK